MPPNRDQWGKRCAKPYRETGVRWDGTVSGCCVDWRNEIELGNTNRTSLPEIWNGPVLDAMRRILIKGARNEIGLCSKCDHPSYRVGLLPDKYGKVKLDDYTAEDVALVAAAGRNQTTVVPIVFRKWEKQDGPGSGAPSQEVSSS